MVDRVRYWLALLLPLLGLGERMRMDERAVMSPAVPTVKRRDVDAPQFPVEGDEPEAPRFNGVSEQLPPGFFNFVEPQDPRPFQPQSFVYRPPLPLLAGLEARISLISP